MTPLAWTYIGVLVALAAAFAVLVRRVALAPAPAPEPGAELAATPSEHEEGGA